LGFLRQNLPRMNEKLDRLLADVADLKGRMTAVEAAVGRLQFAVDGINSRLDRIERNEARLDLIDERRRE
jgi:hypothetical protein